jgi:hypothetical protein
MFRNIVVVGLLALGAAGAAVAADDRIVERHVVKSGGPGDEQVERRVIKHRGGPGHMGHFSIEHAAMHNIMAEQLSAKTGKTPAEIQALFDKSGPHETFEALGLADEDFGPLFQEARKTLITRAQAAGLITAQQAEKMRAAKIEVRHQRRHDDGDDE